MILFGTVCLVLGIAILFNPAILGFIVGFFLLVLGSWIILGWYKVNRVLEKKFSVGKYNIVFEKRDQHKK
ncbi:MAG: hypothetical protein WC753_04015 [Candidatus Gracilibacteria bacterium]